MPLGSQNSLKRSLRFKGPPTSTYPGASTAKFMVFNQFGIYVATAGPGGPHAVWEGHVLIREGFTLFLKDFTPGWGPFQSERTLRQFERARTGRGPTPLWVFTAAGRGDPVAAWEDPKLIQNTYLKSKIFTVLTFSRYQRYLTGKKLQMPSIYS